MFDKKGSDCGTKLTVDLLVTDFNKKLLTDRYIMENGRAVLFTSMTTLALKSFHNTSVKLKEINYEDYIE